MWLWNLVVRLVLCTALLVVVGYLVASIGQFYEWVYSERTPDATEVPDKTGTWVADPYQRFGRIFQFAGLLAPLACFVGGLLAPSWPNLVRQVVWKGSLTAVVFVLLFAFCCQAFAAAEVPTDLESYRDLSEKFAIYTGIGVLILSTLLVKIGLRRKRRRNSEPD